MVLYFTDCFVLAQALIFDDHFEGQDLVDLLVKDVVNAKVTIFLFALQNDKLFRDLLVTLLRLWVLS